jgi:hypothetical protein
VVQPAEVVVGRGAVEGARAAGLADLASQAGAVVAEGGGASLTGGEGLV